MKIIKKLRIKNYRGIKDLELDTNSINVIIGPNNTGKSAILEAIGLFLTFQKRFMDSTGENILNYLFRWKGYNPSYLIRVNDSSAEVAVEIKNNWYRLVLEYLQEGLPEDERRGLIQKCFEEKADELITKPNYIIMMSNRFKHKKDRNINIHSLANIFTFTKNHTINKNKLSEREHAFIEELRNEFLLWTHNSPKITISFYHDKGEIKGLYMYLPESPIIFEEGFYIIPYTEEHKIRSVFRTIKSINSETTERLYDQIIESGKRTLYDAEKMLTERVVNVEKIVKTDKGIMIFTKDLDKPIPLSSMGDGFLSLLYITYLLAIGRNGVILLEEPESSLHPGYGNIVAEQLVHNLDKAQIFLTTHSIDLLESILENGKKYKKLKEINIIRLHYRASSGIVLPEILNGEDAKEEIDEIGTDLRYT